MNLRQIITCVFLVSSLTVLGQVKIIGTVLCKEDKLALPGVKVVEKGTQNETVTDLKGGFTLELSDPNATLVFIFIGMVEKEVDLKGQTEIKVLMKSDCLMDTFDHQYIGLLTSSGIINTPIGGQFEFSFPAFFKSTTLKTAISYQTNLKENEFLDSEIEFDHVIFECDFQMDLKCYYRKVAFDNDLNFNAYSLEANFIFSALSFKNVYNVGLITGYSELTFQSSEVNNKKITSGPVIGVVADIGKPIYSNVFGKISVYNDMIEYQSRIRFDYKKIAAFVKFYKLESYNELSIGVGLNTSYFLKK
ncbi:carboxypeptidase-like regulatory domain-containing protein [Carboxylicivirga sp. RSCT41]|uniref:carboxypeptidase-like regulatory domain-containing protein n=1 Tax=Carboxylicivirga agarovorans TaxID=3417570 RepID=UPI003D3416B5